MLDFFRPVPKKRVVKINRRSGIIFYNPSRFGRTLFHFGNIILIGAIGYAIYLYFPLISAVIAYQSMTNIEPIRVIPTVTPSGIIPTPTQQITPVSTVYSLTIPRIGATANIVEDVSPFDQKEYIKVLKDGVVAQSQGSDGVGYGNGGSTFIFAHSTEQGLSMVRQNSIFYLLGELKENDEVTIDRYGNIFKYRIYMKKVVSAAEIEYLNYSDPSREVLILQTCWPLGTNWRRLLVFGERML